MNKKIILIGILIILLAVFASGCIETPVEDVTIETLNRINAELDKADIEMDISWDAIEKGDYEIAKTKAYNARSYIEKAFRYYLDVETKLTESERIAWRTSFELYRTDFDLTISTIHWFIEEEKIAEIPEEEFERFLTEFEFFIRTTEELGDKWRRHADKLTFIQKTQPDFGITDVKISNTKEWYTMLKTFVEEDRTLLSELKDLAPEYISVDDRIIPHQIDILPISEEIIPRDLARFFDGFDTDGNMELDIGESQDFFYWVEDNIIYRWDCEKAHLRPGFVPGFPIGDGRSGSDFVQTPHETWIERAGDCEDMAIIQVAFFNHFRISAFVASVNAQGREIDHAIAVVAMGGTPEEFADLLGNLVYYEIDSIYFMLVDNAYSDAFGYLCGGLKEGQFEILKKLTLEEEMLKHRGI